MASQILETLIKIAAQADNDSFAAASSVVSQFGSTVNQISQQLIQFGTESANVYKDYEWNMAQAEIALASVYGFGTSELKNDMKALDKAAQEWARTTIFHADDVSNAIMEAARSGWDYAQIMEYMPAVMQLAMAGGMDLSEALDMVVKTSYALGLSGEEVLLFVNQWTYAANRSASNTAEFGAAMMKAGSTMRWAADPAEVLTMISVIANYGTTGEAAGTLMRNSMLRIVAPTKKAKEAFEELGATEEELAEVGKDMDDAVAAYEAMAEYGFSPYDEEGRLKPILQIYREMAEIFYHINGDSWDNLFQNEKVMDIVSAIFPARSIQAAQGLIMSAAENYGGMYEQLTSPEAYTYAKNAAARMGETMSAKAESFYSKVEALQILVGQGLKPDLEKAAQFMGELVTWVLQMPEDTFAAIVKGLEVVAISGPGLMIVAGALKFISSLRGLAGLGLAVVGIAAFIAAINELDEQHFKNLFGDMELDEGEYTAFIGRIDEQFAGAYESVKNFREELEKAETKYMEASSTFSKDLFQAVTTGKQFTQEEADALIASGMEMGTYLLQGIESSFSYATSYWTTLFSGGDVEAPDDPVLQQILGITNQGYLDAVAEAQRIGTGMRNALTSALTNDGVIDEEEYQEILKWVREYNKAMARAAAEVASENDYIYRQNLMRKAQGVSYEAVDSVLQEAEQSRTARLAAMDDDFWTNYYRLEYEGADDETLTAAREQYMRERARVNQAYDDMEEEIVTAAMLSTEYGELFGEWVNIADMLINGEIDARGVADRMGSAGNENLWALKRLGEWYLRWLPTEEEIIEMYNSGDTERAMDYARKRTAAEWMSLAAQHARSWEENNDWDWSYFIPSETGMIAQITGRYTPAAPAPAVRPGPDLEYRSDLEYVEGLAAPNAATNPFFDLQEVGVEVSADATELYTTLDAADGLTLVQYLAGDATNLHVTIWDEDGQVLTEIVDGDTTELEAAIRQVQNEWGNGKITIGIRGPRLFAEGGRATAASIFGEAGPEWAIPEEHSMRTAALLNAAREASGFTWPELLARSGGLNGNSGYVPTTIVYSPTINAQDARGVEEVLRADKERLERWFDERELRNSVEVYT